MTLKKTPGMESTIEPTNAHIHDVHGKLDENISIQVRIREFINTFMLDIEQVRSDITVTCEMVSTMMHGQLGYTSIS